MNVNHYNQILPCQDSWLVSRKSQLETQTCLTRAFALSTVTRSASKKPDFCGLQPVASDLSLNHILTCTQRPRGLMAWMQAA